MFQLLREELQSLILFDNSQSPNKKLKTCYYLALLLDGETAVMSGDFIMAAERFGKVLRDWSEMKAEAATVTTILYSLFVVFHLAGCTELIEPYRLKYARYVDEQKTHYQRQKNNQDFPSLNEFAAKQLEVINTPYTATQIIHLTLDKLYDECVDDWGEINIRHGFCHVYADADKQSMFYCSHGDWPARSKATLLLDQLDTIAPMQRELVARIAQKYL